MANEQNRRVGLLSVGEMGLGVAQLLIAHKYQVCTNLAGRSSKTEERAKSAGLRLVDDDVSLIAKSGGIILSIVPPEAAINTANRIVQAHGAVPENDRPTLWLLELNAISPNTALAIRATLASAPSSSQICMLDGGIIGGPPSKGDNGDWTCPSIPLSGPHPLTEVDSTLATVLNTRHLGPEIGSASTLKMCFASLTKGFAALAIQSFSTAEQAGVLEALREEMGSRGTLERAEKSISGSVPKAWRWIAEMEEIGRTMREMGWAGRGAKSTEEKGVYEEIGNIFRFVSEETKVGRERVKGVRAEDVSQEVGAGLRRAKEKNE